jgi:hypothetical protein
MRPLSQIVRTIEQWCSNIIYNQYDRISQCIQQKSYHQERIINGKLDKKIWFGLCGLIIAHPDRRVDRMVFYLVIFALIIQLSP